MTKIHFKDYNYKLQEYETCIEILDGRNSYSKSDTDATFMRMKEDAMRNGQTKPSYNLQIATEQQFITDFALYPNPTDTLTMIPFLKSFAYRYGKNAGTVVADSGYGSEENYRYMSENEMTAYVRYNYFQRSKRPRFKPIRSMPKTSTTIWKVTIAYARWDRRCQESARKKQDRLRLYLGKRTLSCRQVRRMSFEMSVL